MSSPDRRRELIDGVRQQLPILLGVIPFGLIFGTLAVHAGIPPIAAQGLSVFVFAGGAQFISLGLIAAGVPPLITVLTIFVVNLRHLLYSASLAPHTKHLSGLWKWMLSWLLTDEAYAIAWMRYRKPERDNAHWFFLGTGLTLWATWQISTALGILFGARIPLSWGLEFAIPLTFLALVAPALEDKPSWGSALSAGAVSLALIHLPYKLNLIVAAMVGVSVGLLLENQKLRRREAR